MTIARRLYWDCTCYGRRYPDGIARFTVALARGEYPLPSTFLLPPYLDGGSFHAALRATGAEVRVMVNHPRRRFPWRWYWDQVLDEPGVIIAPGNFHRPVRRWPTVVIVHDLIPYRVSAYARHAHASARHYRRLLTSAAAVITISQYTAKDVRQFAPAASSARILRQGLHEPVPPRKPAGVPEGDFYLHLGGAEPRKDLEAAISWANRLGDAPLITVGGDWEHRRVKDLLTTCALPAVGLPQVDDAGLAWLQSSCRALLWTTRHEGFGLVGPEVLRAGRPVLAYPREAIPEALGDFGIWLDEATNPTTLRQRMTNWNPPPGLAEHLATFSWTTSRDIVAAAIAHAVHI